MSADQVENDADVQRERTQRVQTVKKRGIGALSGDELTKVKGRIQGYDRKAKAEQITVDHIKRGRGRK